MASNFIYGPMASTATAKLPIGGLDWVPGGIRYTDPTVPLKRRALVTGVPPFTTANEEGMRDNLPNGRVHITKAIDLSGDLFRSEHLGLGELLFEYTSERDLPFATQQTRIVTYSDLNRRLGQELRAWATKPAHANNTCTQLFKYAFARACGWKFIGAQPTNHIPMSIGRDYVHMAVAASHRCNIANVFLADNVPSACDKVYLQIRRPTLQEAKYTMNDPLAAPYIDSITDFCLYPYVSKHRRVDHNNFNIYIGIVSFVYGTQFDSRDPLRIQAIAIEAIRNTTRDAQLRAIKAMPTVDIFLGR